MAAVNKDLKTTGECHYTIAKEGLSYTYLSFAVPKKNTYIGDVNKG